jgi:hypothetical protein
MLHIVEYIRKTFISRVRPAPCVVVGGHVAPVLHATQQAPSRSAACRPTGSCSRPSSSPISETAAAYAPSQGLNTGHCALSNMFSKKRSCILSTAPHLCHA